MKDTTNNIMELTAVIKALEYILNIFNKEKNYNILKNNITLRKKVRNRNIYRQQLCCKRYYRMDRKLDKKRL